MRGNKGEGRTSFCCSAAKATEQWASFLVFVFADLNSKLRGGEEVKRLDGRLAE